MRLTGHCGLADQPLLNLLPRTARDDRFMLALVNAALMLHLTDIGMVGDEGVEIAARAARAGGGEA
jgi:hypothetical protein